MTEEKKDSKKCSGKNIMFAYGFIQLGSSFVSAIALAAIAFGFCSIKKELENKSKLPWYSKSVDSNYLTGKRVFIFGDGTHAIAAAKIAKKNWVLK